MWKLYWQIYSSMILLSLLSYRGARFADWAIEIEYYEEHYISHFYVFTEYYVNFHYTLPRTAIWVVPQNFEELLTASFHLFSLSSSVKQNLPCRNSMTVSDALPWWSLDKAATKWLKNVHVDCTVFGGSSSDHMTWCLNKRWASHRLFKQI